MGNTCACLGGGRGYPIVKEHGQKGYNAGEIDDASPSGSYRKTAAAKYKVQMDHNPTDHNKNKSEEIDLDFSEREVEAMEKHESEDSEKIMDTSRSPATHVETFSAPKLNGGVIISEDPPKALDPEQEQVPAAAKTHVEVFSLSVPNEEDSPKHTNVSAQLTQPTESGHINFSDYLRDEKSPTHSASDKSSSHIEAQTSPSSSIENSITKSNPPETVEACEPIPIIDFKNYQLPKHSETFTVDEDAENSKISSTSPVSDTSSFSSKNKKSLSPPKTGISNEAFDISDEVETSPTASVPQTLSNNEDEDSLTEPDLDMDEHHFFFGMESLKFESLKIKNTSEYDGEEADREIAEIMMGLGTIEGDLWLTLRPPEDDTDSAKMRMDDKHIDVNLKPTEDDAIYDSVLEHLRDMCTKVEDVLRRKGALSSDEFDDAWLNLPDLSSIDKKYEKRSVSLQTDTTRSLIAARECNDESQLHQLLDDYKRQQERLLRQREAQRRKLAERLRSKIGGRKDRVDTSGDEDERDGDESDSERVRDQYGAVIMNTTRTIADGESVLDVASDGSVLSDDESECSSDSISSDDLAVFTEADVAATMTLKATLTSDIQARMADMTSDDFQSIMDMYRNERRTIRDIRDSERDKLSQSLWGKLADRRLQQQQAEVTMETVEEEDKLNLEASTKPISVGVEVSVTTQDSGTNPISSQTQDCATGTDDDNDVIKGLEECQGITVEELTQLSSSVVASGQGSPGAVLSPDEAARLLREHFSAVRGLREHREQETERHRQNALDRLRQRRLEEDLDESLETEIEPGNTTVAEDSLEEECLQKVKQQETVSPEDFQCILNSYNQQQQSLIEQRIHQRAVLNGRLRDKLRAAANKRRQGNDQNQRVEEEEEAEETTPENQIRCMDDAFYQSLLAQRQEGELSPGQLAQLIDEHLDLVDEFRREVKEQMVNRKLERRRRAEVDQVQALVAEDKQNRAQVRALRQQERARTDDKLQEKLRRKKQKKLEDGAPIKPERKRLSSKP